MKIISFFIFSIMLAFSSFAGGTQQRSIITTSQLFRNLATNETTVQFLSMLQAELGISNINVTVNVNGITNIVATNSIDIVVDGPVAFIGTNYEAQSVNLDDWSQTGTNNLSLYATKASLAVGVLTNGNQVIYSSTNNPPPSNVQQMFLATDTNAPGFFFVGSNGTWFIK